MSLRPSSIRITAPRHRRGQARVHLVTATAVGLAVASTGFASAPGPSGGDVPGISPSPRQAEVIPDALEFFQRLVARYRSLERYAEEAEVVQVTSDPASEVPPVRSRVRVRARIEGNALDVESSSAAERIAEFLEADPDSGVSEADLRLLPHLRLRFEDEPLENFRPGTRQAFRPAELDRVTVDDRELVKVELLSGSTGSPDARFSLFVNPERMLVERVEGDEWLPGGIRHRTSVTIESHDLVEPEATTDGPVEPFTEPAPEPEGGSSEASNLLSISNVG